MFRSIWATYSQRNARILLLLGFASGLPLALTGGTLQAWITVENVDIKTIGFFSLVSQAYVFKFLWAPFMDRYQLPFLGRRRGWMLTTQIMLIISIIAMSMMKPSEHLWWLAAAAAVVAFCSASQDIIFDAYKTDLLCAKERGTGAAISTLGYRLAMLVSGGLALLIAHRYTGWQNMYLLMAAIMLVGVFATLMAKEPVTDAPPPRTLREAVRDPLAEFFGRNNTWLLLLLIVLYKMGDAFALTLSTPFLIRGAGFGPDEVGLINKTLGLAATIIGALYGGYLMQRWSLFKSLMFFGIIQGFSNLGYWVLTVTPQNIYMMGAVVFIENICGGMGTAAFVALLMTLCNRSFSATQFALLSALSAVGRVYTGPFAGWMVEFYGWSWFYMFTVVAAVPGLLLLLLCRQTLRYTQETEQFLPRRHFRSGYRLALLLLGITATLFTASLILLLTGVFSLTPEFIPETLKGDIFIYGLNIGIAGLFLGGLLDYCALRRDKLT